MNTYHLVVWTAVPVYLTSLIADIVRPRVWLAWVSAVCSICLYWAAMFRCGEIQRQGQDSGLYAFAVLGWGLLTFIHASNANERGHFLDLEKLRQARRHLASMTDRQREENDLEKENNP